MSKRKTRKSRAKRSYKTSDSPGRPAEFREDKFTYGSRDQAIELIARVPIRFDPATGKEIVDPADSQRARKEAIRQHENLLEPGQIIQLRKSLGLSRAALARLTGLGPTTLSRWEEGRFVPNIANDRLLRLLRYPENLERLQSWSGETGGQPATTALDASTSSMSASHVNTLTDQARRAARDAVTDRLARMAPHRFGQVVERLLEAMGYALREDSRNATGSYRILVAGQDPLLLAEPRIRVVIFATSDVAVTAADLNKLPKHKAGVARTMVIAQAGFDEDASATARSKDQLDLVDAHQLADWWVQFYEELADNSLLPMKPVTLMLPA